MVEGMCWHVCVGGDRVERHAALGGEGAGEYLLCVFSFLKREVSCCIVDIFLE